MDKDRLYTADQLAEYYQVTRETIWRWGAKGLIERVKIGGATRFKLPKARRKGKADVSMQQL